MNGDPTQNDPARGRFMVLQALRLSGVAMIVLGLMIINDVIDLPRIAGYLLAIVGAFDALIAPNILARSWKTPLP